MLLGRATCGQASPVNGTATRLLAALGVVVLALAILALVTGSLSPLSLLVRGHRASLARLDRAARDARAAPPARRLVARSVRRGRSHNWGREDSNLRSLTPAAGSGKATNF